MFWAASRLLSYGLTDAWDAYYHTCIFVHISQFALPQGFWSKHLFRTRYWLLAVSGKRWHHSCFEAFQPQSVNCVNCAMPGAILTTAGQILKKILWVVQAQATALPRYVSPTALRIVPVAPKMVLQIRGLSHCPQTGLEWKCCPWLPRVTFVSCMIK